MTKITIGLPNDRALRLKEMAARLGVSPEELVRISVEELLTRPDALLGYAIDSKYYGISSFTDYVRDQLSKLKPEDVNRAIKKYLQAENVKIVVVTKDAEAFKQAAVENKPSPISYTSLPAKEILEEDKVIDSYKLNFTPKKIEVVPVDGIFQK